MQASTHFFPKLGEARQRGGTADDVDRWLAAEARQISTRTLQDVRSILKRAVSRAQARDKVKRNVVMLCELPRGRAGRPSKSLSFEQTAAVLTAAGSASGAPSWMYAYYGSRT